MMVGGRVIFIALGLYAVAISVASRNAHAYPFYIDFQGGVGEYLGTTDPLFASGVAGATGYGLDLGMGFFYTPIEPRTGFDFQIGLQVNFLSASQESRYYGTIVPYPVARLQLYMFYMSIGISPIVLRRAEGAPGFENFGVAPSTLAYYGEAGALYSATPKFSMGLAATTQWFGALSSQPAVALNFVMRFYFNLFKIGQDGPGTANPLEYSGWRYLGK